MFVAVDSFQSQLKNGLSKLGLPKEVLEFIFNFTGGSGDSLKIPEAKGSVRAIRDEPFFIPLYELYLTYGGIFRLTFGPKVSVNSISVPHFPQIYALLSNYFGGSVAVLFNSVRSFNCQTYIERESKSIFEGKAIAEISSLCIVSCLLMNFMIENLSGS